MCGISCAVALKGQRQSHGGAAKCLQEYLELERAYLSKVLDESLDIINHRGPDVRGQWIGNDCHVGMYYPSEARSQDCGRLVLTSFARLKLLAIIVFRSST